MITFGSGLVRARAVRTDVRERPIRGRFPHRSLADAFRALLFLPAVLVGCGPKIPCGPAGATQADAPVVIVTVPSEDGSTVVVEALVAAGSAYDPPGAEGLAALTAQSVASGADADRPPLEVQIGREWVSFTRICPAAEARACVDRFATALADPPFAEQAVSASRDRALEELTEGLPTDAGALGQVLVDDALYEGRPYGHPVQGRAGVLPLLDAAATRRFYEIHYTREGMIAGLAGAWDAGLHDALQQDLQPLVPRPAAGLVLPAPPPLRGRDLLVVDTGGPDAAFAVAAPLDVGRDDADWPALDLATQTFSARTQAGGHLLQSLRAARGLRDDVNASIEPGALPRRQHALELWITPAPAGSRPGVLKQALDQLGSFAGDGVSAEELDANRAWLLGRLAEEARDPRQRLARALEAEATGTPDLLDYLPKVLPGLTAAQMNTALHKHVDLANLVIVATGPDAAGLADRLAGEDLDLARTTVLPAQGLLR